MLHFDLNFRGKKRTWKNSNAQWFECTYNKMSTQSYVSFPAEGTFSANCRKQKQGVVLQNDKGLMS